MNTLHAFRPRRRSSLLPRDPPSFPRRSANRRRSHGTLAVGTYPTGNAKSRGRSGASEEEGWNYFRCFNKHVTSLGVVSCKHATERQPHLPGKGSAIFSWGGGLSLVFLVTCNCSSHAQWNMYLVPLLK